MQHQPWRVHTAVPLFYALFCTFAVVFFFFLTLWIMGTVDNVISLAFIIYSFFPISNLTCGLFHYIYDKELSKSTVGPIPKEVLCISQHVSRMIRINIFWRKREGKHKAWKRLKMWPRCWDESENFLSALGHGPTDFPVGSPVLHMDQPHFTCVSQRWFWWLGLVECI